MPRSLLSRVFRFFVRLLAAWMVLALTVELAGLGPRNRGEASGGQSIALLREIATGSLPGELGEETWRTALGRAALSTFTVSALALLTSLCIGPVLGVLAVRLRGWRLVEIFSLPLAAASWLPAFWLAALAIWWQVEHWAHPGYADGPPAQAGPAGLEFLWKIAQVAALTAPAAIGWQLRHVSEALVRVAGEPHVASARARGLSGASLFYPHILGNAARSLIDCLHRGLPAMLGVQFVVEWVYRFPGLGRLAIDAAFADSLVGLFAAGLILSTAVVAIRSAVQER